MRLLMAGRISAGASAPARFLFVRRRHRFRLVWRRSWRGHAAGSATRRITSSPWCYTASLAPFPLCTGLPYARILCLLRRASTLRGAPRQPCRTSSPSLCSRLSAACSAPACCRALHAEDSRNPRAPVRRCCGTDIFSGTLCHWHGCCVVTCALACILHVTGACHTRSCCRTPANHPRYDAPFSASTTGERSCVDICLPIRYPRPPATVESAGACVSRESYKRAALPFGLGRTLCPKQVWLRSCFT